MPGIPSRFRRDQRIDELDALLGAEWLTVKRMLIRRWREVERVARLLHQESYLGAQELLHALSG